MHPRVSHEGPGENSTTNNIDTPQMLTMDHGRHPTTVPLTTISYHFWHSNFHLWKTKDCMNTSDPGPRQSWLFSPAPFPQINIINGDCLEGKRENYQVCSVQYCAPQLCTVQCTHIWTDLAVLWIGFCLTGPISLHSDSFLYMYYCMHVWYCNTVRWTWWDWSLSLGLLLHSVLWHCWLGHLTRKNPSPIWPMMCLVGR